MKHARKLLSMLVALATIFALLGLSGCSTNTTDYYETVLNLKQFTDMPDIEYRQVLNKYMDDLHGTYSGSDGNYTVTVKGNITSLQQEVVLKFSVSDDTEDSTKCVINSVTATINDNELDQNSTLDYMYQIFSAYQAGCDDLSQWQGSAPESSTNNTNDITEQDRKIIEDAGFEWVEPITVKNSSITGVIRNVSGNVLSGSIQFNLYDESGYQLGEAYDTIADIADGESWRFKAAIIDVDNEVRSYKLISLSMMQF